MKLEKVEMAKTFLTAQMNYWILFSVALTLMIMTGENSFHMVRWGLFCLYPLLLYLIRRKDLNFSAFTGLHLFLGAVLLLLPAPNVFMRILFAVYVAGFTVYSMYLRMNTRNWQDRAIPPMVAAGILVVMLLLLRIQGRKGSESYYIVLGVTYFCLYFLYSYIVQYLHFITVNESSAGYIPVKKMFATGMKMAIPYTMACGGILLLVGNASLITDIVGFVKRLLVLILTFLLRNVKGSEEGYVLEELMEEMEEGAAGEAFMPGESFWLWDVLEKIGMFLLALLLLAAAIIAIKQIYRFVKKAFARRGKKYGQLKEVQVDRREKCEAEKKVSSRKRKNPFAVFSNREHIRRIYKKKIEAERRALRNRIGKNKMGKEACLSQSGTARECLSELQADPLAQIYEKARYTEMECSAGDLKEAKKWQ